MNIEAIANNAIHDKIVNGMAILAGNQNEYTYDRCFGYAENSLTYPMRTDTVIDIASVTKAAATVTALLVCHSRGLIDFDAPFTEYLKDFKPQLRKQIRIKDLANHTSGFCDPVYPRLYFDESGTKMLENMLVIPPPAEPSDLPSYSCWNYILLSMILERITGRNFSEFCRNEIFLPLGMMDSSVGKIVEGIPPERTAQTIVTEKPGQISDFVAFRIYRDGGATGNAGLLTTAKDMEKLLRCYLRHGEYGNGKRLFSESEYNIIKPDTARRHDGYRRFGWIIYDKNMNDALYGTSLLHSGWSGQTVLMNFKKDFFAVVLTTRCGDYDRAKADRFEILRQLFAQA